METLRASAVFYINQISTDVTMLKRTKMFAGVVRIKLATCKAGIETRDRSVEEFGFHCHVETIVNASATVLRIREKRQNMERQLLPMELNPIMDMMDI